MHENGDEFTVNEERRQRQRGALGSMIAAWRLDANLTQEGLAILSDIGSKSISSFETGERVPDAMQLSAICRAFGITLDSFVTSVYWKHEFDSRYVVYPVSMRVDLKDLPTLQKAGFLL